MKRDTAVPGSAAFAEALAREADEVNDRIEAAFGKLAGKLRAKADKAKARMEEAGRPAKRARLMRRFELYADAARHLEDRPARGRGGSEAGGD